MKLVSFGKRGNERAGIFYNDKIIDINKANSKIPSTIIRILEKDYLNEVKEIMKEDNKGKLSKDCYVDTKLVRIGAVIPTPGQIICMGLNYRDHAAEAKAEIPSNPLLFAKAVSSINGPYDDIIHPGFKYTEKMDYEVELAIVIGRRASRIKVREVFEYISGYVILNDISARDVQFSDKQWFRGKSFDTFCPLGPYLVTKDEIKNPSNIRLLTRVNGEVRQDGNTKNMIFSIPEIIEFITSTITLNPGDIVTTGTPSGVGIFMNPPQYLKSSDAIETEMEGLGTQKNNVVMREDS
ncbi:MAG: fumarylacetoacetate hydrolase family protein [Candidatus Firestonebacteria bacterium]